MLVRWLIWLDLTEPGPEFLHVTVGAARETHAERQHQVFPVPLPADPFCHQGIGDRHAQVPLLRSATPNPIALAREVDGPVAALRTGHRPPRDDAHPRRGRG